MALKQRSIRVATLCSGAATGSPQVSMCVCVQVCVPTLLGLWASPMGELCADEHASGHARMHALCGAASRARCPPTSGHSCGDCSGRSMPRVGTSPVTISHSTTCRRVGGALPAALQHWQGGSPRHRCDLAGHKSGHAWRHEPQRSATQQAQRAHPQGEDVGLAGHPLAQQHLGAGPARDVCVCVVDGSCWWWWGLCLCGGIGQHSAGTTKATLCGGHSVQGPFCAGAWPGLHVPSLGMRR